MLRLINFRNAGRFVPNTIKKPVITTNFRWFSAGVYDDVHSRSIKQSHDYWRKVAATTHWFDDETALKECSVFRTKHPDKAVDDPQQSYSWFPDSHLNTCYNALDVHVEQGNGNRTALIYDSPVTTTKSKYTYDELLKQTQMVAGALVNSGVKKGDRVLLYMPMIPEALIAMLACARIGAVHCVVFGGFAANELAKRIDQATPTMIITASCGVEPTRVIEYKPILNQAISLSTHKPSNVVVLQRDMKQAELDETDSDWYTWLDTKGYPQECVVVKSTDPLYIIHTSGTTGMPKGVVRDNGGHMVAMKWSLSNIYGIKPGMVWWAASDIGWVVGHSYIVYSPLINGGTTVLYEGKPVGTPDAGAFWRVIEEYKVSALFAAPTALRAIKKEDPEGKLVKDYNISSLNTLFLAGERADPDSVTYAQNILNVPVIDHYWQTESGWPIAANCVGVEAFPVKLGSSTKAVPGWDVRVVSDEGKEVSRGTQGNIVVKLPLPPGALLTLWGEEERFVKSYFSRFPGYYDTTDSGYIDEDGYIFVMSRTDDVMNVAGHRLSSGAMEESLCYHKDVAEAAVIAVPDSLKGFLPLGFVVLNSGVNKDKEDIKKELKLMVRERVGAVASLKDVIIVTRLPKTRSGKILRATMRSIAEGKDYVVPATIEDPVVLEEIKDVV